MPLSDNALPSVQTVWSSPQHLQVTAEARLRALAETRYEGIIKYDDQYRSGVKLSVTNWLAVLSQRIASLLFPRVPAIQVTGNNTRTVRRQQTLVDQWVDSLNLHAILTPTATRVSWAGQAWWKLHWSPRLQRPAIRVWGVNPGEVAFEEVDFIDPAAVIATQYWYPVERNTGTIAAPENTTYYVCERHESTPDGLYVTTTAYETRGMVPCGPPLSLARVWPQNSTPPQPEYFIPGLIHPLGYRIANDGGVSDYTPALQALQEQYIILNTQRMIVIRLCESPNIDLPAEYLLPDGSPDWTRVSVQVRHNGEESTGIKLSGWTGALSESATQEQILLNQYFLHCPLSRSVIDAEATSNTSGFAKQLDMQKTITAIESRRAFYKDAFRWMVQTCANLTEIYGTLPTPIPEGIQVEWPDVVMHDEATEHQQELAERQQLLAELAAGVRSKDAVIAALNDDPAALARERVLLGLPDPDAETPDSES